MLLLPLEMREVLLPALLLDLIRMLLLAMGPLLRFSACFGGHCSSSTSPAIHVSLMTGEAAVVPGWGLVKAIGAR